MDIKPVAKLLVDHLQRQHRLLDGLIGHGVVDISRGVERLEHPALVLQERLGILPRRYEPDLGYPLLPSPRTRRRAGGPSRCSSVAVPPSPPRRVARAHRERARSRYAKRRPTSLICTLPVKVRSKDPVSVCTYANRATRARATQVLRRSWQRPIRAARSPKSTLYLGHVGTYEAEPEAEVGVRNRVVRLPRGPARERAICRHRALLPDQHTLQGRLVDARATL